MADFGHGVNRPGVLDLLTSKWGHGSPVSWAAFLPMLSFLRPPVLDLGRVRHGTDRRRDRQRPSIHNVPPYGGGDIKIA